MLGVDFDEECSRAGGVDGVEESGVGVEAGAQLLERDGVGLEEFVPDGHAEAGAGVTTDVAATEVVFLGHADGGIAVVVEEKDFEVEFVDRDGAEFLKILGEASVAFDEEGAARMSCLGVSVCGKAAPMAPLRP